MPPTPPAPFYFDWTFWSFVVAAIAVVLSQIPPILSLVRPRRLKVEVHDRVQIAHYIGNPMIGIVVTIDNAGGRNLRIRRLTMELWRDGNSLGTMTIQGYFETASAQSTVLFVPFSLKASDTWSHGASFYKGLDRQTDKRLRESIQALNANLAPKKNMFVLAPGAPPEAEPTVVAPILTLFNTLFIWQPGEYVFSLTVETEPSSASYKKKYRFTLYESETAELRKYADEYKYGVLAGQSQPGVFVPITEHIE
jgi:hypothetical protein